MYNGMNLDAEAIIEAYKNETNPIVVVDDTAKKCYDKDYNEITIDSTKVATARASLDAEYAKIKYKDDRAAEYPDWQTQLDYIYHNGIDKWKSDIIDPIKTKYPKPS
tara:strand:- start:30 stop:350 length:321 start_codon:yes stop_codon:yes gene_type:complete